MAKGNKPDNFQEFETATKAILEAEGQNYFEWLHAMHMEKVLEVVSKNPKELAALVQG